MTDVDIAEANRLDAAFRAGRQRAEELGKTLDPRVADAVLTAYRRSAPPDQSVAFHREEAAHMITLAERDRAEEWASNLAGAISEMTGVDIGEHSNLNNPWANALDAIRAFGGGGGRWLVHLVRTAAMMAEETECDAPNHDAGEDCDSCAWDALYQAVPQSVKAMAERAAVREAS
jgi:hypothetical protein